MPIPLSLTKNFTSDPSRSAHTLICGLTPEGINLTAFPNKLAVIVPAEKFPEASLETSVEAVFKFVNDGTQAFENEIGMTSTEIGIYVIKSAVEKAVEEMIFDGEKKGLWKFKETKKEETQNEVK